MSCQISRLVVDSTLLDLVLVLSIKGDLFYNTISVLISVLAGDEATIAYYK